MAFSHTQKTSMLDVPILQKLTSTGLLVAVHDLGYRVKSDDGREYMYIRFDNGSGVAAVAGAPCVVANSEASGVVTSDVSESIGSAIGCFLSILTDKYYGWIQTKGRAVDCPCTDGSNGEVAAGDPLGSMDAVNALWYKVTVGGTQAEKAIARAAGSLGFATIELIER